MVRTRFAPSPTGFLHLGNARAALFSWAFARHSGGQFILRIEDTDIERSTEEAVQVILQSMKWLGLDYDKGPIRQTSRLARYREVLDQLLDEGLAYRCYATKEELDELREAQRARNEKPRYDGRWQPEIIVGKTPPTDVKPVIRFRNPLDGEVIWDDMVKGEIRIANTELDDLVIARPDMVPTYNFAVVVDDLDMKITHVVRGDDHVNNTPRQINIYKALGALVPLFAHLPTILGSDGEKLSKRHGAVSVMQYPEDGYLPEALFNYLARLGWSHGDAEKFSRDEFIQWFGFEHVSKSAAQFNGEKLLWLNQEYIKEADDARLASLVEPRLVAEGFAVTGGPVLTGVIALLKDRAKTIIELADAAALFYTEPQPGAELLAQHLTDAIKPALQGLRTALATVSWATPELKALLKKTVEQNGLKFPQIAMPLRVLLTGQTHTPSINAVMCLLGREKVPPKALSAYWVECGSTLQCMAKPL